MNSSSKKNNFDQNYWNRCVASAKLNLGGTSSKDTSKKTVENYLREEITNVEDFKIRCSRKDGDKSREGPWKGKGVLLETDLDQADSYNGTGG